jgi:hypothetical protein
MMKAEVIGMREVQARLKEETKRLGQEPVVELGFGTRYAVYVHERTELHHKVGQAKFLQSAANEERRGFIRNLAADASKLHEAGHPFPLAAALYRRGLKIIAKAVKRTPVLTGRLRQSRYVAPPAGVSAGRAPAAPRAA